MYNRIELKSSNEATIEGALTLGPPLDPVIVTTRYSIVKTYNLTQPVLCAAKVAVDDTPTVIAMVDNQIGAVDDTPTLIAMVDNQTGAVDDANGNSNSRYSD